MQIYKEASYEMDLDGENKILQFQFDASEMTNYLYGYVDSVPADLILSVDGTYRCAYETWLSYKIFSVGDSGSSHTVTLEQFTGTKQDVTPYFYYLDQTLFEEVIQELKSKEMQLEIFEDGHVLGSVNADQEGQLLLTIPFDGGWKAVVNGKETEIKKAAFALMAVPLTEGENEIELLYQVQGTGTGLLLSCAGILLFAVILRVRFLKQP